MKKIFIGLCFFFLIMPICKANEDLAPNSKSAIMMEASTGEILFEKNSHEKLAPASMTKVMSMLLIMEAIDKGKLNFNDEVEISANAASMGGSQVFLQAGEVYLVEELLKGVAIASGNDAVVALGEKVAGSISEFNRMMNQRAKELGMKDTVYLNPHGLDEEGHYTTAYDMALVAKELVKHEQILKYTSLYEYYLKKSDGSSTWLVNTNKLVRFYEGVDGLKTGFTTVAKYCLTATAKKNDLRLITVVMGVESGDLRSSDTVKMLNFGFNTYKLKILLPKNKILGKVRVLNGKTDVAEIKLIADATILSKVTDEEKDYSFNIKVKDIKAPVKVGEKVGTVEIIDNEAKVVKESDLTISKSIEKANLWDYFKKNLAEIAVGKKIIKNI